MRNFAVPILLLTASTGSATEHEAVHPVVVRVCLASTITIVKVITNSEISGSPNHTGGFSLDDMGFSLSGSLEDSEFELSWKSLPFVNHPLDEANPDIELEVTCRVKPNWKRVTELELRAVNDSSDIPAFNGEPIEIGPGIGYYGNLL